MANNATVNCEDTKTQDLCSTAGGEKAVALYEISCMRNTVAFCM